MMKRSLSAVKTKQKKNGKEMVEENEMCKKIRNETRIKEKNGREIRACTQTYNTHSHTHMIY